MGKGSDRRPRSDKVSADEFNNRWDQAFSIKIQGTVMKADQVTLNGRVYPRKVLDKIAEDFQDFQRDPANPNAFIKPIKNNLSINRR